MSQTLVSLSQREIFPAGKATYAGSTAAFSPPATPTDLFVIGGAAGKTIEIYRIGISTRQTTAGNNALFLIKRSTANSGGTPVATTNVPLDARDPAASAVVQHYTANPTPGSTIGNVWSGYVNSPAPATAGVAGQGFLGVSLDFVALFGKPIILADATQQLAWNFAGAALPAGLSVFCQALWAEV